MSNWADDFLEAAYEDQHGYPEDGFDYPQFEEEDEDEDAE